MRHKKNDRYLKVVEWSEEDGCYVGTAPGLILGGVHGKDEVKVFFIGKGVEYQKVSTDKFNTVEQADKFLRSAGKIYACGTCIKSRDQGSSEMCPISTMKDMHEIVKESDKVVTF